MAPVSLWLIASGLVLGCFAGPLMARTRWPVVHPGTAIVCWAGIVAGVVISVLGLFVVLLLSPPAPAHGLLEWLDSCLPLHAHTWLAVGPVAASAGSIALVAGCGVSLARGLPRLWRTVVHVRQHREVLRIVARRDDRHPDLMVIDHPVPVAYCLPARSRPIVVSTGAQARLTGAELAAVLAHERAHLRQRHHLLLLLLDLVCTLLPGLPTLRMARASLPTLLEMAADDAAARRCGPHSLSAALRRLTVLPSPTGALAAAGTPETGPRGEALARRLARLEADATDAPTRGRALAFVTAAAALAGSLGTAALALMAVPLPC
ncbi:MAG TPA: M56 family metallopeptidase [Streptosporangiaceae bacterium]|nr:M56 family metallopeptidase [Streptosporangiaceae bacterium]